MVPLKLWITAATTASCSALIPVHLLDQVLLLEVFDEGGVLDFGEVFVAGEDAAFVEDGHIFVFVAEVALIMLRKPPLTRKVLLEVLELRVIVRVAAGVGLRYVSEDELGVLQEAGDDEGVVKICGGAVQAVVGGGLVPDLISLFRRFSLLSCNEMLEIVLFFKILSCISLLLRKLIPTPVVTLLLSQLTILNLLPPLPHTLLMKILVESFLEIDQIFVSRKLRVRVVTPLFLSEHFGFGEG